MRAAQLPARRPTQTSGPPPVLETGVGDGVTSGLIVGVGWISGTPGPVGAKVSPKSLTPQELDAEMNYSSSVTLYFTFEPRVTV